MVKDDDSYLINGLFTKGQEPFRGNNCYKKTTNVIKRLFILISGSGFQSKGDAIMKARKAFSLIELLIVVAIVAILAAIAVPNFLEAQTRARVARVKADFRNISTALGMYYSDWEHFPPSAAPLGLVIGAEAFNWTLYALTTPVAYMTNVTIYDPFAINERMRNVKITRPLYMYLNYEPLKTIEEYDWAANAIEGFFAGNMNQAHKAFVLWTAGPDRNDNILYWADFYPGALEQTYITFIYDPSNGTISRGDIARLGGDVRARDVHAALLR
jgi:prepilin-type N-terminal cleavage/methylation domain-containing protein